MLSKHHESEWLDLAVSFFNQSQRRVLWTPGEEEMLKVYTKLNPNMFWLCLISILLIHMCCVIDLGRSGDICNRTKEKHSMEEDS